MGDEGRGVKQGRNWSRECQEKVGTSVVVGASASEALGQRSLLWKRSA